MEWAAGGTCRFCDKAIGQRYQGRWGNSIQWEKRWKGVIELNTSNKHLSFPLLSPFLSLCVRWVLRSVACMHMRERESVGGVSWVIGIRQMTRCEGLGLHTFFFFLQGTGRIPGGRKRGIESRHAHATVG